MPGGYHNQARMIINSSGTGAFSLSAALLPFNAFATVGVVNGEIVPYSAIDFSSNQSEKGWGVYSTTGSSTGGPSLTRNVFTSTNANNAINAAVGTQVFIDPSVADLVQLSLAAHTSLGGL